MLASKFNYCGYQMLADKKLNNINYIFKEKNNFLRIAKGKKSGNLSHSCLSSQFAYFIDKKIDDSLPLSGKIFADTGYEYWQEKEQCICKENKSLSYCNYRKNKNCFLQIKI